MKWYIENSQKRHIPNNLHRSHHLFPVICCPLCGVSWGGVCCYKMFYKLRIRWLGKRNMKKKTYLRGGAQMTSIIIWAPFLFVIVSPSSLSSHHLGVCLIIHSCRDGKSVPSSGAIQCNNYKLRIKIEYISYITEPKKRYLNQMMIDIIWACFLRDVASRSVEGMQVASLQPQDLLLGWVTRDLWWSKWLIIE